MAGTGPEGGFGRAVVACGATRGFLLLFASSCGTGFSGRLRDGRLAGLLARPPRGERVAFQLRESLSISGTRTGEEAEALPEFSSCAMRSLLSRIFSLINCWAWAVSMALPDSSLVLM
jgi:hypothetical protein